MAIVEGDFGHSSLVDGSVTTLHRHAGDLTRVGALYPGVLSPGIKPPQVPYKGVGFTVTELYCRATVAAAGVDLKVKIRHNGTSMGEVNLGTTQEGTLGSLSLNVSDGDYFDIEITQVGSTPNEGSDLVWLVVP